MVQDPSSSRDHQKDEPDILDLKAAAGEPIPDAVERETIAPAAATVAEPISRETETPSETVKAESNAAAAQGSAAPHTAPSTRAEHQRGTSMTALVGAGIIGGLIALLAGGSMQYAGYIPGAAPTISNGNTEEIAGLRAEIDGLKQQLATIPAEGPQAGDLEKRITALEADIGKAPGADPETASKLAALEERLAALQSTASTAQDTDSQKLDELSNRLAEAEKTLKEQPGEAAVSRAIAATYLKAAVDRGDPFLTEVETFAALAPEDPAVQELRALAANGVKSKAQLASSFNEQAKLVLDAVNQPATGEGFTDRLLASAQSLISVRPVGNVEGTDAGAILARMEDKLKNGDIKGASLEWDGLPEPGKKATEPYKADLERRARVDELTRGIAERSSTPALNAG